MMIRPCRSIRSSTAGQKKATQVLELLASSADSQIIGIHASSSAACGAARQSIFVRCVQNIPGKVCGPGTDREINVVGAAVHSANLIHRVVGANLDILVAVRRWRGGRRCWPPRLLWLWSGWPRRLLCLHHRRYFHISARELDHLGAVDVRERTLGGEADSPSRDTETAAIMGEEISAARGHYSAAGVANQSAAGVANQGTASRADHSVIYVNLGHTTD